MIEQTFVMIKPDGVSRRLVGEIISVFERAGLEITAMKMTMATADLVRRHYPDTEDWYAAVGGKTLEGYAAYGMDPDKELGTSDPIEIGKTIKEWLVEYITSGPVVAMVVRGNRAVANVRRLCGKTLPLFADPGSIRGRYGIDSPDTANAERRPVYNLMHASGEPDEAETEISLWFPDLNSR